MANTPKIVQETDLMVEYLRKIIRLEREVTLLKKTEEKEVPPSDHSLIEIDNLKLRLSQSEGQIQQLETALATAERSLTLCSQENQTLLQALQAKDKEAIDLLETIHEKDNNISELTQVIGKLQLKLAEKDTISITEIESNVRKTLEQNRELQHGLQDMEIRLVRAKELLLEAENRMNNTQRKNCTLNRFPSINIPASYSSSLPLNELVAKSALFGVQEDYLTLHRKYSILRDEKSLPEAATTALGRVSELESKLKQASKLVSLLRHDVEALLGWRVEFFGRSVLLTMVYSGLNIEVVRSRDGELPEYRISPGLLMRKSLQNPEACVYLSQAKSFPAFLACNLLSFVNSSHSDLQY